MEDHVQTALKDKDAIKKMKKIVSHALDQMKLQVRKHNEKYKDEIADCRANPSKYVDDVEEVRKGDDDDEDEEEDDESDSDSDSEEEDVKPKAKTIKKPTKAV